MITISQVIISYLIGSIPTAFLLGKFLKGIDIRDFGSGNVGATNAFRVLGKPIGTAVLIFDVFKGFFVVAVLAKGWPWTGLPIEVKAIALGLIAIIGHNWPIFLRFKGGKGIAISLGVILGLAFTIPGLGAVLLFCILLWSLVFFVFGYVSLASISCALLLPVLTFAFVRSAPALIFSLLIAFFAIFRHKPNISRLLEKKEPKVKLPWSRR